eukprot:scaffold74209_cov96-Phaeocystis_antarctica.AAC.1
MGIEEFGIWAMFDVVVSLYVGGGREVVCFVFYAILPRPSECGTWPTNILARLETPTSSSSPAASLFLPGESCKNLFHLTSSASCDVLADSFAS